MSRRGDLSDRVLLALVGTAIAGVAGWLALLPDLPPAFRAPGSPALQSVALAAAALLLVPLAFALAKRSGRAESPPLWFSLHALAAVVGTALAAVHACGRIGEAPALPSSMTKRILLTGQYL